MTSPTSSTTGTVTVVGLGKIGLPLAVQYASRGWSVHGLDIDQRVVDLVNAAVEPFPGETDLAPALREVVSAGRLVATTDGKTALDSSSVVVVVVPLIVDELGTPNFAPLDSATEVIGASIRPGTTVLYETTLPVHTTRQRFVPILEATSGLRSGSDMFVAFSPERVYSGRIFADLRRYPKLVGGVDRASARRAIDFYTSALEFDVRHDLPQPNGVWDLGSAEAAELAKLAETTYRDINIAFANELAVFSESAGIDVYRVIDAANSQPFSHIHRPGVAVGGHCIPVYPRLFLTNAPDALVPAAARASNERVPLHAVEAVSRHLGGLDGRRVVVLGAAYRGGVKETAFSGVFPLVSELTSRGATALVHDPLYGDEELARLGFEPYHYGDQVDAGIVQADHAEYSTIGADALPGIEVLYDGRRISNAAVWTDAGVTHVQLGVAAPAS